MSVSPESSIDTLAIRGGEPRKHAYDSVTVPIACTATYAFENTQALNDHFAGRIEREEYGRYGNPTVEVAEHKLAALDGADAAVLFPSGMNAVTTLLLSMLRPGDHIVLTSDVYRRTRQFVRSMLARFGIEHSLIEPDDYAAAELALQRPNTRLYLSEAPTNPYLRVPDVARIAALCRELPRVKIVIDATLATPVNFRPLAHGAHLVLHSCTKYLAGHNDLLAGALCGDRGIIQALREARGVLGGMPDPHGAYLLVRGMKTLAVRMRQHNQSGLQIARFLAEHPAIARVYYPGLESHPDHATAARQFSGFGGVISFLVDGDLARTSRFIDRCRIATIGASMGAVETLIQQPALMSHSELSSQERAAIGAHDNLVRLSVGLEDPRDLMLDFAQALE
ncbi:MAG TPA: PLP-dependent aspartate aminotransferase family protein [Polyangiales bacterium]|nr:PLP-dependent aspartate aminotransferase family protein [Polyangiales bacterium]